MFALNDIALRPLEVDYINALYRWDTDAASELLAGWSPIAPSACRQRYEQRFAEPRDDLVMFGVTGRYDTIF